MDCGESSDTSPTIRSLRFARLMYSEIRRPAPSWIEFSGATGKSTGEKRMSRPRFVTAPISVRLVVRTSERRASCLLRRTARGAASVSPAAASPRSTRSTRPVVERSTRHETSASSITGPALRDPVVAMLGAASVRRVRLGVPNRSATSSSSLDTSARRRAGLASSSRRRAIAAVSSSRSVSSSTRENLVSRRNRSSRMYSAWRCERSKTSMRRARACSLSSLARITWMTSSMSTIAMSSPSTRWRRSSLRARRYWLRRVTTEMRWST